MPDLTQIGVQDFLDKMTIFGIPGVLLVAALVALGRLAGIGDKWIPLMTIVAGAITATLIGLVNLEPQTTEIVRYIVAAVLLGLAGSGGYSLVKKFIGFTTVPPGSKVVYPDGTQAQIPVKK